MRNLNDICVAYDIESQYVQKLVKSMILQAVDKFCLESLKQPKWVDKV